MDKLVFCVPKKKYGKANTEIVRVSGSFAAMLRSIADNTHLSQVEISSVIAEFVQEHIEYVETELEE